MKETYEEIKKCLGQGKTVMLVTVAEDHGSSPRGAGACMAVGEEGRLAGTIGGGTLEFLAVREACGLLRKGAGAYKEYRLSAQTKMTETGMVCGGDVDVLFSFIPPDDEMKTVFEKITDHLSRHKTGWVILPLCADKVSFYCESGMYGAEEPLERADICSVKQAVRAYGGEKYYIEKLQNDSRVYIFGGGHLAQALVPLLSGLEFGCVVTDDRPEYSAGELFPDAQEVHTCSYTELYGRFDIKKQDYIVIMTRGHEGDYDAEKYALTTPACYIGCVGSRSKIHFVNEKLRADGVTEEEIARIISPIGLDIRSETPAEIAVSIAAQLILVRAGGDILNQPASINPLSI